MLVRGLATAIAVVVLDQLGEAGILGFFTGHLPDQPQQITPFFNIVLIHNRGMSFGLFNHSGGFNALLFSLVAAVIVTVLIIYWLSRVESSVLALCYRTDHRGCRRRCHRPDSSRRCCRLS